MIAPLEWSVWLCEVVRTVRVLRRVPAAVIPSFGFLPYPFAVLFSRIPPWPVTWVLGYE